MHVIFWRRAYPPCYLRRGGCRGAAAVPKTALITGVTGQDGAYLSRLLLKKGYRVVGAVRHGVSQNLERLKYLDAHRDVELIELELLEVTSLIRAIEKHRPDEIYNLAAQSMVPLSIEEPIYTLDVNALGFARLLEAVRIAKPDARVYQASSSEMFGIPNECPQTETTALRPRSLYGVGKVAAHWLATNYREIHGLYTVSGILFNHESPLRGRQFVTRRITLGLAEVKRGKRDVLTLGNLDARRDWGYAEEYVEGMWVMLQQDVPGDYVLLLPASRTRCAGVRADRGSPSRPRARMVRSRRGGDRDRSEDRADRGEDRAGAFSAPPRSNRTSAVRRRHAKISGGAAARSMSGSSRSGWWPRTTGGYAKMIAKYRRSSD